MSEIKPPTNEESKPQPPPQPPPPEAAADSAPSSGGGWGFSPLSVFTDLQKAAEEISRNATEVAKTAAKSFGDMQDDVEDSEYIREDESATERESDDGDHEIRNSALEKLEKASEDTIFGQGLKDFDSSVENLASVAWNALGSAWKEGANLVQKLENSATNFSRSIEHDGRPGEAGTVAPSLVETGKSFATKGMQVLEVVGKETMDILIAETGIKTDKDQNKGEQDEEITFDRCFYIYGGPEQLEELEALSNHHALLFNRGKAKLPAEEKSVYDVKLKEVQRILNLSIDINASGLESDKGKKVETGNEGSSDEMKKFLDSSVSKAADLATGFSNALTSLSANDMKQRTVGRLESLHSEGVHRLSEMCCFAVTQLLMVGKSMMSKASKVQDDVADDNMLNIDWPEDLTDKAKVIRMHAQLMKRSLEAVSNSFLTGISDVAEAYLSAMSSASAESHDDPKRDSIQEKVNVFAEHLRTDQMTAAIKIQDGLQYLSYLVISASMP